MNIKEVFERERWTSQMPTGMEDHNASIDRIEAAVIKHIAELVGTLDKAYDDFNMCNDLEDAYYALRDLVQNAPKNENKE